MEFTTELSWGRTRPTGRPGRSGGAQLSNDHMYVVYVLHDESGKCYKGMTNDLERRFLEHTQGQTKSTRFMRGLRIVYTEQCLDREAARKREKYLKSAAGRKFLKDILGA